MVRAIDYGIAGAVGSLLPVAVRALSSLAVEPGQPAPDSGFYLALCLLAGLGFVLGLRAPDMTRAFAFGLITTALLTSAVGGAMNATPQISHAAEKIGPAPRPARPTDIGGLIEDVGGVFPGHPTAFGDFRWALGAPRYLQPAAR